MIRYPFVKTEVEAEIAAIDPNWLRNAAKRTQKFLKSGSYEEKSSIWSAVKPVYMKLQHNKCVFCERQLEGLEYGKIEHDLEHFRPKSSVLAWPDPERHKGVTFPYSTGAGAAAGYYWLAYDLNNYAAACKVCNSSFKSNYFPVSGVRATSKTDLDDEQSFLCYPLGELDADPQNLVTFMATTAVPKAEDGYDRRRGEVIIEFFGLNKRPNLHLERARMISLVGGGLYEAANCLAADTQEELRAAAQSNALPHAGCLRSFIALWERERAQAVKIYQWCRKIALGISPPS